MRKGVALAVLFCATFARLATAQDQDRKLLDRVLKPDMELKNNAQDKQFHASGVTDKKKAATSSFQFENKTQPKTFTGSRSFFARLFSAKPFHGARQSSLVETAKTADAPAYASIKAVPARQTHDADRQINTRDFAQSRREFRDQGKSPKSLQQKNHPLTIDEVRELLNKNK